MLQLVNMPNSIWFVVNHPPQVGKGSDDEDGKRKQVKLQLKLRVTE